MGGPNRVTRNAAAQEVKLREKRCRTPVAGIGRLLEQCGSLISVIVRTLEE
jgi:hypothetical protein